MKLADKNEGFNLEWNWLMRDMDNILSAFYLEDEKVLQMLAKRIKERLDDLVQKSAPSAGDPNVRADIIQAYSFLRKENHDVPSEVIELMKDAALKAIQ